MHLYLHIPFCKQACHYCDFHFSTSLAKKSEMVKAICNEISLQKDYLHDKELSTIYFGGGTPSLLSNSDLEIIFSRITEHYTLQKGAEITLECNPDDITIPRLQAWRSLGINRLSIGIQSFNEAHLKFLNRAHSAEESSTCIKDAIDSGFDNLSLDLIYAIPSKSNDIWKKDLQIVHELGIAHISSYCLTIEEKTVFGKKVKKKLMEPIDDNFASDQFNILLNEMAKNNYEQYEISNFAKVGKYAKHNTSYWQGDEYLGVGPSAHSFNKLSRQWNISNNALYLKSIQKETVPFDSEILNDTDRANEYIMTGLRTKWGVNLNVLEEIIPLEKTPFPTQIKKFENNGLLTSQKKQILLTNKGKLMADFIASELFF
ncbi:MAG: oxygen-independent coproporphyrinogen-3 oxidase [Arcticibacterium sp.]|jgi:oxygen-independent coproporphyrinogen-3 oxidase